MALEDLLQWLAHARKRGRLHVEQDGTSRRVWLDKGRIVACSSNDPPTFLGQFLLARGWITGEALAEAMGRQERTGENLGVILCDQGILTKDMLDRYLESKAEESIFGLFEWEHAEFEFDEEMEPDEGVVKVDINVQNVLMQGAQRRDEMNQIRETLPDHDAVLALTSATPPETYLASPLARKIHALIDGRRTISELLLHTHGSMFLTLRFLADMCHREFAEIRKDAAPPLRVCVDEKAGEAAPSSPVSKAEIEKALETLCLAFDSEDETLTVAEVKRRAEAELLEEEWCDELSLEAVPRVIMNPGEEARKKLSPTAVYLIDLIRAGNATVKSLLWIAPRHREEVLAVLKKLRADGWLEITEPEAVKRQASG